MDDRTKLVEIAKIYIDNSISRSEKILKIKNICDINIPSNKKEYKYNIDQIEHRIKLKSGLTYEEINSLTGRNGIWRQMAHYMSWKHTDQSLKAIGSYFGKKDHSTVLNSVKVISNYLETDKQFRELYQEFLNN